MTAFTGAFLCESKAVKKMRDPSSQNVSLLNKTRGIICVRFHAPEHFVQFVGRHTTPVVHKTEAQLFSDRHNINPDVLGCDAWVRCIIYDTHMQRNSLNLSATALFTVHAQHDCFLLHFRFSLKLQAIAKRQSSKYNITYNLKTDTHAL